MNFIPIALINGSLGSGKTTLVRHLLASDAWHHSMLIENEFASVNIDQQIVAGDAHEAVMEISGTCICCSNGEELEQALEMLAKIDWRHPVMIEATGMANSAKLAERLYLNTTFLERFEIVQAILLIDPLEVDAGNLTEELMLEIRLSDTVLITKADLANEIAVVRLREEVAVLNPAARVIVIQGGVLELEPASKLSSGIESRLTALASEIARLDTNTGTTYTVLKPEAPVDVMRLEQLLRRDAARLGIRRVKGFVRDAAGAQWLIEATDKHTQSTRLSAYGGNQVLVVIGDGMASRNMIQELGL